MIRWFIVRDEKEEVVSALRLKEMAVLGELQPTDLVRREDAKETRPAGEVYQLFPRWYVRLSSQQEEQGPFNTAELKAMLQTGELESNAILRHPENYKLSGRPVRDIPLFDDQSLLLTFGSLARRYRSRQKWIDGDAKAQAIEPIASLGRVAGDVCCLAFSKNGKLLASGTLDGTILLWDMFSHKQLSRHDGHAGQARSLAFSVNDKTLASGGIGSVRIWRVGSKKPYRTFAFDQNATVCGVAFWRGSLVISPLFGPITNGM